MVPQVSADEGECDDDYFVRLMAFSWRHRILCAGVVLIAGLISVVLHESSLPYRTTISLRLVSPCVAYKHHEYWGPSSKAWRSQLNAEASKHQSPVMHITVTVGEEPWLATVTAEHAENDQVAQLLQDLVNEVELQLGAKRFASNEVGERVSEKPRSFAGSSDLMFELRQKLTKIERALAPYNVTQHSADSVQVNPHAHVSGTWSPVPIESVPYFPWFESLQARVCEELSVASHAKNGEQLMVERQEIAQDLEQASILMTQVWFSLDPLNPVNELPHGNVQSVYSGPNHGESIIKTAALGCWFGAVAVLMVASIAMWVLENASKIAVLSKSVNVNHRS